MLLLSLGFAAACDRHDRDEAVAEFEARYPDREVRSIHVAEGDGVAVYYTIDWSDEAGRKGRSEVGYLYENGAWRRFYDSEANGEVETPSDFEEAVAYPASGPPEGKPFPCDDFPEHGEFGPFRVSSGSGLTSPVPRTTLDVEIPEGTPWGVAFVEVVLSAEGTVQSARVFRGITPEYDEALVQALLESSFEPATRGGEPVAACYIISSTVHVR